MLLMVMHMHICTFFPGEMRTAEQGPGWRAEVGSAHQHSRHGSWRTSRAWVHLLKLPSYCFIFFVIEEGSGLLEG